MVLIPAGDFPMGTDSQFANADQKPIHNVYLDAFYIDKHEVTNAEYEEFILAGGYTKKKYWTAAGWDFIQKSDVKSLFEKYICRVSTAHQPLKAPAGSSERIVSAI